MQKKYRSMNAYIDTTPERTLFISYRTPLIVLKNGKFYAWRLQYSPTTSKQTTIWLRDYEAKKSDVIMISRSEFEKML